MADSIAASGKHPQASAPVALVCRLRTKPVAGDPSPLRGVGEVELENLSPDVLEISYQMSVLQYLELCVTDPCGSVVSEGRFGDRFSPTRHERVLRLQPGEKFRGEVPLLGTVPREKRVPGVYRVQAVYEYEGVRAVSNALDVTWS